MPDPPVSEIRKLEDLQFNKRLQSLLEERRKRDAAIDADMLKRGYHQFGPRGTAILGSQARFTRDLIDGAISARREMAVKFAALGEPAELEALRLKLEKWVDGFGKPHVPQGVPEDREQRRMAPAREQEAHRLTAHLKSEVEILKQEFALNLHAIPTAAPAISVNTGGGPAIVNLGEIRGDVQQVVGTLNAAGHAELAGLLDRLAAGIEALTELGEERAAYLEQVRFIAQEAVAPEEKRQASVVRAVFESLRGRLQDTANLAQVLALAGPAIARHFGIHWPF
jgi:hypothetical protein